MIDTLAQPPAPQRSSPGPFTRLRQLLEMIRFSHTLFALPFALLAAVMAWRQTATEIAAQGDSPNPLLSMCEFSWRQLLGILLCMVTARSAAMAFNRVADWRVDALNPRTQQRHIPAGILSLGSVQRFGLAMSLAFVASTAMFLPNRWPLILALPVLAFLLGYSFAKRFTTLAHLWLGAALSLAPVCAWIALRGPIVAQQPFDILPAVLLGSAVMLWVAGFDMIYACQDAEFDRQAGLFSIPARWGVPSALRCAAALHAGLLLLLAGLPWAYPAFGWVYWVGLAAAALLIAYEHSLVRPNDLTRVNVAFFRVNAVVSLGLLATGILDLYWRGS